VPAATVLSGAVLFAAVCLAPALIDTSERSVGTVVQDDAHEPHAWRTLTANEQALFDHGYAVFNTEWVPANTPAGRVDKLGPVFSAQSCDACHNSRRRGRGPRESGAAPADLVVQLGHLSAVAGPQEAQAPRAVTRGDHDYGFVLSTSAVPGFKPEGRVSIQYEVRQVRLADGTSVELREPRYRVDNLSGPRLMPDTVLMPRVPPSAQGAGLLERVPPSVLEEIARAQRENTNDIRGQISRVSTAHGALIGRFGWQATEPTLAGQIALAFAREMGLTNPLVSVVDCGRWNSACRSAPAGGSPEVESDLFEAVVAFERWHAVPIGRVVTEASRAARLFQSTGCSECHRLSLRVDLDDADHALIHPYTDLLLHDLGQGLADRDLGGTATLEKWRTAPLWGMHAAYVTGRPQNLLHDGRARSIEEAILWHDAEGRRARENYMRLTVEQRHTLVEWIQSL